MAVLEGAGAVSVQLSDREVQRVLSMSNVIELFEDQYIRASQVVPYSYVRASAPTNNPVMHVAADAPTTADAPKPVPTPDLTSWALTRVAQRRRGSQGLPVCLCVFVYVIPLLGTVLNTVCTKVSSLHKTWLLMLPYHSYMIIDDW